MASFYSTYFANSHDLIYSTALGADPSLHGKRVTLGDAVDLGDEISGDHRIMVVHSIEAPRHMNSTGRVILAPSCFGNGDPGSYESYFPVVIGAKWVRKPSHK